MQNLNFLKTFCAAITLLITGLMIQSCGDCKDITCQNGGTCDAGTCSCPTGYTGDLCQYANCSLANVCYVNSTCEADPTTGEALCVCNAGYEGDTCGTLIRTRLLGTYNGAGDACVNQDGTNAVPFPFPAYTCSVTTTTASNSRFIIQNFGDFPAPQISLNCMILGSSSWDIDDTTFVNNTTTKSIEGVGTGTITASGNKHTLNIDYKVVFIDNTYQTCDMEMTQQ